MRLRLGLRTRLETRLNNSGVKSGGALHSKIRHVDKEMKYASCLYKEGRKWVQQSTCHVCTGGR